MSWPRQRSSGSRLRERRSSLAHRGLAGVVAVFAASMAVVWLADAGPASAKDVPAAITGVTTDPPSGSTVAPGQQVKSTVSFCLPDGTRKGDTTELDIPGQLLNYPKSFDVRDPSGALVADAVISGDKLVLTYAPYVDGKLNVCGSAFFSGRMNPDLAGTTQPLKYTTPGGRSFTSTLTVSGTGTHSGVSHSVPHKVGAFTGGDATSQCRADGTDCIRWQITTATGPLSDVTFSDTLGKAGADVSGQTIDCPTAEFVVGDPDPHSAGLLHTKPFPGATLDSCTSDGLHATIPHVPAGKGVALRVLVSAPVAPNGGVTYKNTAVVSSKGRQQRTVTGAVTSAADGGNASGDLITLVKYATADGPRRGDFDTAPGLLAAQGAATPVTIAITNDGSTVLRNISVVDQTTNGPRLVGLRCTFPDGSTGTTWAGPFAVGATFTCTGRVPGMSGTVQHSDTATVTAIGNGPVRAADTFNVHANAPTSPSSGLSGTSGSRGPQGGGISSGQGLQGQSAHRSPSGLAATGVSTAVLLGGAGALLLLGFGATRMGRRRH